MPLARGRSIATMVLFTLLATSAAIGDRYAWWSFQPIERPRVPSIADGWIRTPVDAFVLDALRNRGLTPAGEADRRTLIRRVTYDLTGLPPTPSDVERFVADPRPDAYERLVDRLLASPRYGERWAQHWLDVVQYADTCGYDKDKLRPNAWPYRDYVIRSFNDDTPFARFVQEQVAGDVLFPGERDGVVALGFIAAGPWDFIGHVEVPESKIDGQVARNLDRDDMVANVFNTFCSVTVQCARCHDHKADPWTQEHYYALQSVFAAIDRADRPYDTDPEIARRRHELDRDIRAARHEMAGIEVEIHKAVGPRLAEMEVEIAGLAREQSTAQGEAFGYHSAIEPDPRVEKWVALDFGEIVNISTIILHPCHDDFAGIGAGFGFPVRYAVELSQDGTTWHAIDDQTGADVPNPGIDSVTLRSIGRGARHLRIRATRLGERSGDYVFALGEVEVRSALGRNIAPDATVTALDSIEAAPRWGRDNVIDESWAKPSDPDAARRLADLRRARDVMMLVEMPPELRERYSTCEQRIRLGRHALDRLPKPGMVYAAATHFPPEGSFQATEGTPRPIHVLRRGNVLEKGAASTPGVLPLSGDDEWLLDATLDEGGRRAALARWLTAADNPLIWRSIVNRVWQHHFGAGLVTTPNDFGRMGAEPSHPELLDWLATSFRTHQSFKTLHRLIVTSSVYRQASTHDDSNARVDASNRYLWRMPRRRLDAESTRDSMLFVSGVLDTTMGGPGYYLFQLERAEHSPHYEYHTFDPADATTHRRSIYRFIVRSQPDPWMTTLDCADSSQSTPKRTETLTSLQALSLLNSRFTLVMAERLASRLEREVDTLPAQIALGFVLALQREATDEEHAGLLEYAEAYGLTNFCRLLFNLNEFVYVD